MRRVILCIACLAALFFSSAEGGEFKSAGSSSGRFYVSGDDSAIMLSTANWADTIADRIDKVVKIDGPTADTRAFYLLIRPGVTGRVSTQQSVKGGRLSQQILFEGFEHVDWETALEAVCELYIDGYLAKLRRKRGHALRSVDAPDWFTIGIAQRIDPGLRSRNTEFIVLRNKAGLVPALKDVLSWTDLVTPSTDHRALSGLLATLILYRADRTSLMKQLLARVAEGKRIEEAWLIERMPDCESSEELERAWRNWIARECRTVMEPGVISVQWLRKLQYSLQIIPGSLGVPIGDGSGAPLAFSDLIERKKESWVPTFCARKMAEIRMITIGRPQRFVDAGEGYCVFFDRLARRRWDWILRKRLGKAEEGMRSIEAFVQARKEYVDRVEAEMPERPGRVNVDALSDDVLERSEMQRYIDRVERELVPSSAPASDGTHN